MADATIDFVSILVFSNSGKYFTKCITANIFQMEFLAPVYNTTSHDRIWIGRCASWFRPSHQEVPISEQALGHRATHRGD